MKITCIDCLL